MLTSYDRTRTRHTGDLVALAELFLHLWSSDTATLVVPRTYTRFGDRAFPVAGPRLWNSLPSKLRQSDLTLHQFRRALKTYLFCWLRLQHLVTLVFSVLYKCFYLLTYCWKISKTFSENIAFKNRHVHNFVCHAVRRRSRRAMETRFPAGSTHQFCRFWMPLTKPDFLVCKKLSTLVVTSFRLVSDSV